MGMSSFLKRIVAWYLMCLVLTNGFKFQIHLKSLSDSQLRMSTSEAPKSVKSYYIKSVQSTMQFLLLSGLLTSRPVAAATTSQAGVSELKNQVAEITDYVYLDVKIANYTEESIGRNRGATGSGRLILGLYGKDAPLSVARFLSTLDGDGESTPTFYDTIFSRIVDSELLDIEKVRGINVVNIAGTDQVGRLQQV